MFMYPCGYQKTGRQNIRDLLTASSKAMNDSEPKRIQRRRTKGWRMPENTLSVCRPGPWGNPFVVGRHGTRDECVDKYDWMAAGLFDYKLDNIKEQKAANRYIGEHVGKLRGKNLACFCKVGDPCHGDVLLYLANK